MDFFYSIKSALKIAAKVALFVAVIVLIATVVILITSLVGALQTATGPFATITHDIGVLPAVISHYFGSVFWGEIVVMLGFVAFAIAVWAFVKIIPALKAAIAFLADD